MTRVELKQIKDKIKNVIKLNNKQNKLSSLTDIDWFIISFNLPKENITIIYRMDYDSCYNRLSISRQEFPGHNEPGFPIYKITTFERFITEFTERIGDINKLHLSLDQELIELV